MKAETERHLKCPKCRGERLLFAEVVETVGMTGDPAPIRIADAGLLVVEGPLYFGESDFVRAFIECECGHSWTTSRRFTVENPDPGRPA